MKKKILSTLLAVCLFVGMAVPAISAAAVSDVQGDAKNVDFIVAAKETYEIEVGKDLDLSGEIKVIDKKGALVLDQQHIRYDLQGISGDYTQLSIKGGKITANVAGAEANVNIYDNYSKNARVNVKIRTVPSTGSSRAESATFAASNYVIPYTSDFKGRSSTGKSENVEIKMESHPKGSKFQPSDVDVISGWVASRIENVLGLNDAAGFSTSTTGYSEVRTEQVAGVKSAFNIDLTGIVATTTSAAVTLTVGGQDLTATASIAAGTAATPAQVATAIVTANATVTFGGVTYDVTSNGAVLNFKAQTEAPSSFVPTAYTIVAATSNFTTMPTNLNVNGYVTGVAPVAAKIVYTLDNSSVAVRDVFEVAGMKFAAVTAGNADAVMAGIVANVANLKLPTGWVATGVTALNNTITITGPGNCIATPTFYKNGVAITASTTDLKPVAPLYATTKIVDGNMMVITIPYSVLDKMAKDTIVDGGNISFVSPKIPRLDTKTDAFTAATNLNTVLAVKAEGINTASNFEVTVGATADVDVTYFPMNANVGKKITKTIARWNGDNKPFQYATMDGEKILGVNPNDPGKARLETKLVGTDRNPRTDKYTFVSNITVKPYAKPDGSVTPGMGIVAVKEMTVGTNLPIEMTNIPRDVTVSWSFDSKVDGIVDFKNWKEAKTEISAKKAGTVKVIATLSNGQKFTHDITVKAAAPVVKPVEPVKPTAPTTDATKNPQTGDSLFANLFA